MLRLCRLIVLAVAVSACAPSPYCEQGIDGPCTFEPWDHACADGNDPPCETSEPILADRSVDVLPVELGGTGLTYVVTSFSLSAPDDDRGVVGFNVDGIDSGSGWTAPGADCEQFNEDGPGRYDPAHVGADNAVAGLVGTAEGLLDRADCLASAPDGCFQALIADSLRRGAFLLAVQVRGVDSLDVDPRVEVSVHQARVVGGRAPAIEPSGELAAGQTPELLRTLAVDPDASLFRGRVRARFEAMDIPFERRERLALPPDHHERVELRFDIHSDGLDAMVLGGVVSADELVDEISAAVEPIFTNASATIRSIVESVADIAPTADPEVCGQLSVGYELAAVPAIIE